jgi:hypothetical protein
MSRKPPRQASLFDAEPAPVASADLLRIDQRAAMLTPAQQALNRPTEQIGRAREKLALWEALAQRLHERTGSEIHP